MTRTQFDALVIGGGIVGRCAMYHLQRRGLARVGLVERFALDHSRGSSHSHSRITRSVYVHAGYSRLMQVAHGQEWPRLATDTGEQLILPSPGCFFGPSGGKFDDYARSVIEAGVDCDVLDVGEARKRFPMFRFATAAGAVHDHTAGVIAAQRTMTSLLRLAESRGATMMPHTRVLEVDVTTHPLRVLAQRAHEQVEMYADRIVICPGPWATDLLPFLTPRLQVTMQTVGYFILAGEPAEFAVGRWPVWGNLGAQEGEVFYGLPAFGREGIKIARHIVSGSTADPELAPTEVAASQIDPLRAFLAHEFVQPVESFTGAEHCYYTNTATEDYILDLHPKSEHVAIGAGFSGHGFKLAPVCGRVLAELVLDGSSSVAEFEAMRPTFSLGGPGSSD
jgi:sarcosine oxidase